MNFADITDIAIPAGDVIKIQDSGGTVLWEKPFTGSTFTMYFKKVDSDVASSNITINHSGLIKLVIDGGYFTNDDNNIGNTIISGGSGNLFSYKSTSNPTVVTVYNPQNVKTLSLGAYYDHLYSFSNMSSLTNLETLRITHNDSFTQPLLISNLPKLKGLYIDIGVTAADALIKSISISNLPSLTYLDCNSTTATLSLNSCPQLEEVWTNVPVVSGGLSTFSGLSNLTNLAWINIENAESLSTLSRMTNLKTLQLMGLKVTGDLSALSNLVNLKSLSLGDCISATGNLSSLSKMSNLTFLNLSSQVIQPNSSGGYSRVYSKFTGDASVMRTYAPNLKTFYYQYSAITGTW